MNFNSYLFVLATDSDGYLLLYGFLLYFKLKDKAYSLCKSTVVSLVSTNWAFTACIIL